MGYNLIAALVFFALSSFEAVNAKPSKNETKELVVYSARNEQLIRPVFDAYTKKTGVQIRYVTDNEAPLIQRLKGEARRSPADILLTVDAGNLWHARQEEVLQAIESETLNKNIPQHLRDPDGYWYGLSVRARTIAYNVDKVDVKELSTYEDLTSEKWKNRLCLRTSQKVYNQSLVAMMIAKHGEKKTQSIVEGWVANLAAPVFASDTEVLRAIAAGRCDVGIVNSYYYGRLMNQEPDLKIALFWANQDQDGVHVNVSGAGVTRHAPNKKQAVAFLEWLSSSEAQNLFVDLNFEFPANSSVKPSKVVAAWGNFSQNVINVSRAGELQVGAVMLMDRARYQ